jgi:hypothetical protein
MTDCGRSQEGGRRNEEGRKKNRKKEEYEGRMKKEE